MFPEGRACVRKSVASLRHPTGMFSLSWGQTGVIQDRNGPQCDSHRIRSCEATPEFVLFH